MSVGLGLACAIASAQQANEEADADAQTSETRGETNEGTEDIEEATETEEAEEASEEEEETGEEETEAEEETSETQEKRFRWFSSGRVYMRYGGFKPPAPTRLLGFGKNKPASQGGGNEQTGGNTPPQVAPGQGETQNVGRSIETENASIERENARIEEYNRLTSQAEGDPNEEQRLQNERIRNRNMNVPQDDQSEKILDFNREKRADNEMIKENNRIKEESNNDSSRGEPREPKKLLELLLTLPVSTPSTPSPPSSDESEDPKSTLFQSYNKPSLEPDGVRLDLYELLLGFEARSPKNKKWQGKVRGAVDLFALGERLSGGEWGGRYLQPDDFDSAAVHEAFVSLSRKKVGELRLGITDGVTRRLDAGASEISTGRGFFGDLSRTPWHIERLGQDLGNAASDNFPKAQYLSPRLYGVSLGGEWYTNFHNGENSLATFSQDSSTLCLPSLFYSDNQGLFEYNNGNPPNVFQLYDNTAKPLEDGTINSETGNEYFLQKDLLPAPVLDARCWQGSSLGSSWHEEAHPRIMGGNVALAYEKDFAKKSLSLKVAARYGIRSSKATAKETDAVLKKIFALPSSLQQEKRDEVWNRINRSVTALDQAAGVSAGVVWNDYSFFGGVTYLFPTETTLHNIGGETLSDTGREGLVWSLGIKAKRLIPHKKKDEKGKRKKKGTVSVSFSQAFVKDPRYNEGEEETTLLLNLQSLYPITEGIAFTFDYWYGDVALEVPFFVTSEEYPSQGVLFHERRLLPNHEFIVGFSMRF